MDERFVRQSFLGNNSQDQIEKATVGIIGLGGGGSHIAQQMAHLGFANFVLYDPDIFSTSNSNRTIGMWESDIDSNIPKVEIAYRMIKKINSRANVQIIQKRWQDDPTPLSKCNFVIGCVDGFGERRELEVFTRRFALPLIDIGLGVHIPPSGPPVMAGQVILSHPGCLCMTCMNFLTQEKLDMEAATYGDAGPAPQVVWANGVLASSAVGILVELVTNWTAKNKSHIYLQYEANTGFIGRHKKLEYVPESCIHFPIEQEGPPKMIEL